MNDLLGLIYPRNCLICQNRPMHIASYFCQRCTSELPFTDLHNYKNNELSDHFWGRSNIETGTALFYFYPESRVQQILHEFKYKGRVQLGEFLGSQFGELLINAPLYKSVDLIVPVPIHSSRKRKRGYNQSEIFAKGISEQMNIPIENSALIRYKQTATQTRKDRRSRIRGLMDTIRVQQTSKISGKHILLVDDVITTGATLSVCANKLLEASEVKISIACIALAQ